MTQRSLELRVVALYVAACLQSMVVAQEAAAREADLAQALGRRISVRWNDVTVRDATARISDVANVTVWLDRSVDPTQKIALSVDDVTAGAVLARVAAAIDASAGVAEGLVYIGPSSRLYHLQQAPDLNAASRALKRTLRRPDAMQWSRLDTPASVISQLAEEQRLSLRDIDRTPHDLLPAGALPKRPVAAQLSLLLVGFDLGWQVSDTGDRTLVVVPLTAKGRPVTLDAAGNAPARNSGADARYTLRIREQPLSAILAQISERVGRELVIEPAAAESARSRVSFSVKEATLEELVAAASDAAGLRGSVDGARIVVGAR